MTGPDDPVKQAQSFIPALPEVFPSQLQLSQSPTIVCSDFRERERVDNLNCDSILLTEGELEQLEDLSKEAAISPTKDKQSKFYCSECLRRQHKTWAMMRCNFAKKCPNHAIIASPQFERVIGNITLK